MLRPLLTGALLLSVVADVVSAQDRTPRARARVEMKGSRASDDRAFLGISTSSSGERDTLGLLVTSVTADSPAEKAGIEEGSRIASINSVSLRLAAADAGESEMRGLTARRLTRELGKVKAGDEVELRLYQNGAFRTVKVKTAAARDVIGKSRMMSWSSDDDEDDDAKTVRREERAVLGLTLNPTGGRRDTLGVLITQVAENGPAEKNGIVEGDRVAAINGIDLRVPSADAGDDMVSHAKSNRFSRAMRNVKAGESVELRVYSGGQTKTVKVTAGKASEVYEREHGMFFFGEGDPGVVRMPRMPRTPMPAIAPMPPMPPMPRMQTRPGTVRMRSPMIIRRGGEAARDALVRAQVEAERAGLAAGMQVEVNAELIADLTAEAYEAGIEALEAGLEGLAEGLEGLEKGLEEALEPVEDIEVETAPMMMIRA